MSTVFDPAWLETMRERLLAHRMDLQRQLAAAQSSLSAESQYQEDEGTVATHPADEASDLFSAEVDATLMLALEDELSRVDAALKRMDSGTYGICVECGQPIEPERLEAIPWAERCIRDQERFEATQGQRRR
ncbi:TraR/DksA C4-type zinc finger protein [Thermomicrobiaceae bacterium CFH 74404]|uniref:TraR/DksA C4-type zinc finger protein n=1 Tax=Thermalbibacter longus TaxID=2951981 RepID=A0AA41WI45_9BACT|nr:TraR/DksA C4-type zinc finger protein [Thermalbibacter longus]MCM8750538.1 TraR/DksA C4-type zinc finger protein [Thermalbibacter longus]